MTATSGGDAADALADVHGRRAVLREMYAASDDPWGFATRWYEQRKRALTLAALPDARYRLALEPGCGTGLLTEALAARCDRVEASDTDPRARELTRARTAELPGVRVGSWALGDGDWPAVRADLLVLSEVGYYLDRDRLRAGLDGAAAVLEPGAVVVSVHWRHPTDLHVLLGDETQAAVRATDGWEPLAAYVDEDVVLDVLVAGPAQSVARREGLV